MNMTTVTEIPIQLNYFVADMATALATFDTIRWHRSRTGAYGYYDPATAAVAAPASLLNSKITPHQLNGKTLKFRVNGVTNVSITFASADPITSTQAANEINLATGLVVAADDGNGYLLMTTVMTGSDASIEIQDGDANPFLGYTERQGAVGVDVDTPLVLGTHEYFWTDENSSPDFWYRVEFLNSTTFKTSGLGVPFPAVSATTVSKSRTIVAFLRLADFSGNPISGRRITLANTFEPNLVQDMTYNWGVFRSYTDMVTDGNGYAEIRLLRGMLLDIAVEGTNFVRRLRIPTTGDSVDLLDPALVAEDEFGIQQPKIDFAIRTS